MSKLKIPLMTQKKIISEMSNNVWYIKHIIEDLTKDNRTAVAGLWEILVDTVCYADDLRGWAYRFVKFPSDKNKEYLENHIGKFHKIYERVEMIKKVIKGDTPTPEEKENSERNN